MQIEIMWILHYETWKAFRNTIFCDSIGFHPCQVQTGGVGLYDSMFNSFVDCKVLTF
jgi:hypothetical protein